MKNAQYLIMRWVVKRKDLFQHQNSRGFNLRGDKTEGKAAGLKFNETIQEHSLCIESEGLGNAIRYAADYADILQLCQKEKFPGLFCLDSDE